MLNPNLKSVFTHHLKLFRYVLCAFCAYTVQKGVYEPCKRIEKKTVEHESDCDTNCDWCSGYSYPKIDTGIGGLGNRRTSGDHPNYIFIKISQSTEKSPRDRRRLAVTHSWGKPSANAGVKNSQKSDNNNNNNNNNNCVDWLIFKWMWTCLELFYAQRCGNCTRLYDIKYSYRIKISVQLYGFLYPYLMITIIWFWVIISI